MADEKKIKNEELTDEQANAAAGGGIHIAEHPIRHARCELCEKMTTTDEMLYTRVNGKRLHICFECAGIR